MKTALIIGGTRGIGKATADALRADGWDVTAWGRDDFNVHNWSFPYRKFPKCDAFVFCAGDFMKMCHSAFDFPVTFYMLSESMLVNPGGAIIAVSSVAADKPAKVNPHYAAAKAALESYARTVADSDLAKRMGWRVEVVRFDLVDTDMMRQLPPETLAGRTAISAEEAACEIMERINARS